MSGVEYNSMSTEELKVQLGKYKMEADLTGTSQLAKKTLLNAMYGALANRYFRHYRMKDAEAITLTGQLSVRYMTDMLCEYMSKVGGESPEVISIYNDTDSQFFDTIILVNGVKISIGDFFDQTPSDIILTKDGTEVKMVTGCKSPSMNQSLEIEERDVVYVMRHFVNKLMVKVRVGNDEVVMTEDHSLMVVRNSQLVEVKPLELNMGDAIVRLLDNGCVNYQYELVTDFEVEDIGIQEVDVYDIEVEGNHNFFGNNILVHNSAYLSLKGVVEKFKNRVPKEKMVDFLDQFIESKLQPVIDRSFEDLTDYLNSYQNTMAAKREAIAASGIWCVHPSTMVTTEAGDRTIEDMFNDGASLNGNISESSEMVKCIDEETVDAIYDQSAYIIRKKYVGKMYRFTVGDKSVDVTENHLMYVFRNQTYNWIRAKDVVETDTLVVL